MSQQSVGHSSAALPAPSSASAGGPPLPLPPMMSFDDFQRLPSDRQSEEIFRLLSLLTPFASEVSSLRSSVESCLNRLGEVEMLQRHQQMGQVRKWDFFIFLNSC